MTIFAKNFVDMEEKELKAKDIPMGYPLCFNEHHIEGTGTL